MGRRSLAAVLVLAALPVAAFGELRLKPEDQDVVRRAEAIVVGHLEAGSIEYVQHPHRADEGMSWEHRATLVVTEVVSGSLPKGKTPVVIHYGLNVLVDGRFEQEGNLADVTSLRGARAKGIVEIVPDDLLGDPDTGRLIGEDMRDDHVWFLRHAPEGFLRGKANHELLGVLDPEDLQPLRLRGYFSTYLADDPEPGVRAWLRAHPNDSADALRFLEHCEVRRIARDPDLHRRVERLLPYFRGWRSWGNRDEVRESIEACGDAAGPYLVAMLRSADHQDRQRRWTVLEMLGRIRYAPAYEPIAALVAAHDSSFENWMKLPWWSDPTRREQACRDVGSELCAGIAALGQLGDTRAAPLIRRVSDRWSGRDGWGESVRGSCRDALKLLDPAAEKPR